MHSGIGSAASGNFNGFPKHGSEGLLQCFLHGDGVGLLLPSGITGAEVGESEEVAHQCSGIMFGKMADEIGTGGIDHVEHFFEGYRVLVIRVGHGLVFQMWGEGSQEVNFF